MSEDELTTMQQQKRAGFLQEGKIKQLLTQLRRTKPGRARSLQSRAPRASPRTEEPTHTQSHTASPLHACGRRQVLRQPSSIGGSVLSQACELWVALAVWRGQSAQTLFPSLLFLAPVPTSPQLSSRVCFSKVTVTYLHTHPK